jgi:aspartate oxidase
MTETTQPIDDRADPILQAADMADLATDLWRIGRRAKRDDASEAVLIAHERAIDRLIALGFEIKEMEGEPYYENLRVKVVHMEGGHLRRRISECLSPAIFFHGHLIKQAEVVIQGEEADGTADR